MYSKYRTLNQTLSLINTRIDLPRDAVIDQIILKVVATVANAGQNAYAGTNEAILRAIQEIRVVSDGSTVHYALSGADIALLNAYNSKAGFAPALGGPVAIDAAGSETLTYYLRLDEGDILAASKDSLEAKIVVNPTITADVTITALTVTVTLVENVLSPEEFIATYGPNLEYAAEPKIYALQRSRPAYRQSCAGRNAAVYQPGYGPGWRSRPDGDRPHQHVSGPPGGAACRLGNAAGDQYL